MTVLRAPQRVLLLFPSSSDAVQEENENANENAKEKRRKRKEEEEERREEVTSAGALGGTDVNRGSGGGRSTQTVERRRWRR